MVRESCLHEQSDANPRRPAASWRLLQDPHSYPSTTQAQTGSPAPSGPCTDASTWVETPLVCPSAPMLDVRNGEGEYATVLSWASQRAS